MLKSSVHQYVAKFSGLLLSSGLIIITVQLLLIQAVKADCVYAEERYATGATRGSYVCMPDGSWQEQ
jgi:hypothetical protein